MVTSALILLDKTATGQSILDRLDSSRWAVQAQG